MRKIMLNHSHEQTEILKCVSDKVMHLKARYACQKKLGVKKLDVKGLAKISTCTKELLKEWKAKEQRRGPL